jgi:membrane-bound lytic murein transglycosylase D
MCKFIIKPLFIVLLLSLVTACTDVFVKPNTQAKTESGLVSKPQEKASTTWQDAYGEPQASEINQLSELALIEAKEQQTALPEADLWQRIRNGYAMTDSHLHPKSQKQLNWFVKHPEYVDRVVERARPYLHYIVDQIEQRDMPLEIALLPVVESGFQPFAYSSGKAAGIWQFIPGTGKVYGLEQNWWYDGRRDIIESTRAALDYLQKLHNDFGDWQLALAAYNCGEGAVGRAIKRNKKLGKPTDFWSLSLPRETSAYVPKLLGIAELVKHPDKYNIKLSPVDNLPFLTTVDIGSQMDLALAAELAGLTKDQIYQLNPGFNRWATRPNGPHRLVLPLARSGPFLDRLLDYPLDQRVRWSRHKIKTGESLGSIAQHYSTTVSVIKQANKLETNFIRAGQNLLIPSSTNIARDATSGKSKKVKRTTKAIASAKSGLGTKKIHTVQAGDTWWDLARANNVSVLKLTDWNGQSPADTLKLGQKLVIWSGGKSGPSDKSVKTVNYEIQSGDSLWKISKKFNVSIADVRDWNDLSERTLLKPGQNLTLHIDPSHPHGNI